MAYFDNAVYNFSPDDGAPSTRLEASAEEPAASFNPFENIVVAVREATRKAVSTSETTRVRDIGQIDSMRLFGNWEEGKTEGDGAGSPYSKKYHIDGDPQIQMEFYYRGHRVNQKDAKAFRDVLDKEPHYLDLNELNSLSQILSGRGWVGDNTQLMAKTEKIDGKTVLIVEQASKLKPVRSRTVLVDADSQRPGSVVQEIIFRAPSDRYSEHVSRAVRSAQSIEWK